MVEREISKYWLVVLLLFCIIGISKSAWIASEHKSVLDEFVISIGNLPVEWQNTTEACNFTSINCDSNGFIVNITLSSLNLTGSIPSSIGNLTTLERLDLHNNSLSNGIPTSIETLVNLTTVLLNDNNFDGNLPIEFRNLTELVDWNLNNNNLDCPVGTYNFTTFLTNLATCDLSLNFLCNCTNLTLPAVCIVDPCQDLPPVPTAPTPIPTAPTPTPVEPTPTPTEPTPVPTEPVPVPIEPTTPTPEPTPVEPTPSYIGDICNTTRFGCNCTTDLSRIGSGFKVCEIKGDLNIQGEEVLISNRIVVTGNINITPGSKINMTLSGSLFTPSCIQITEIEGVLATSLHLVVQNLPSNDTYELQKLLDRETAVLTALKSSGSCFIGKFTTVTAEITPVILNAGLIEGIKVRWVSYENRQLQLHIRVLRGIIPTDYNMPGWVIFFIVAAGLAFIWVTGVSVIIVLDECY